MTTLVAGVMLIVALASFAQTLSGFGFALVAVPLLTLLLGPQTAVIVVTALGGTITLLTTIHQRRHVDRRTAGRATLWGLVGMPVGLLALSMLSARSLSVLIAGVVLVLAAFVSRGKTVRTSSGSTAIAGLASGAMLTSTGMNGPPLVASFQAMGLAPREFRATLQATFCIQDALALVGFLLIGQLTPESMLLTAVGLPGMVLGWWLGDRAFGRIPPNRFRLIVLALLVASACTALAQAALH